MFSMVHEHWEQGRCNRVQCLPCHFEGAAGMLPF